MIINADDFGISKERNLAIEECFNRGLVHRTTIMVNMPAAEDAKIISEKSGFSDKVGLHINLTQGPALNEKCRNSILCDENGIFKGTFHVPKKARLFLSKEIKDAIYAEVNTQINKYLDMGFTLKHADSHNYTHTYFSVAIPVNKLLKKYDFRSVRISRNIPPNSMSFFFILYKELYNFMIKRMKTQSGRIKTTRYFGSLQDFTMLDTTKKDYTDTEIMTHPTYVNGVLYDDTLPSPHPWGKVAAKP